MARKAMRASVWISFGVEGSEWNRKVGPIHCGRLQGCIDDREAGWCTVVRVLLTRELCLRCCQRGSGIASDQALEISGKSLSIKSGDLVMGEPLCVSRCVEALPDHYFICNDLVRFYERGG